MNFSRNPYGGSKAPSTVYAVCVGSECIGYFDTRKEANEIFNKHKALKQQPVFVMKVTQAVMKQYDPAVDEIEEIPYELVV
jgi:hypothetical protein